MQRRLCLLNLVRCSRILKINEAVIKMIIKGRSPTMRHVSRTHRVALDWLFDSINLEPMIHIKYVDTKKQLADILTKGNLSSASCPKAMSKKMPQGTGEERVVAKSKPTLNLVSHAAASSLTGAEFECIKFAQLHSEHPVSKVRISKHRVQGNLPVEVQINMTQRQVLKCG